MKRAWGLVAITTSALMIFGILSSQAEVSAASGTSIAGKSCTKRNITKVVSAKKYTCVLKNKKLVWNGGVSVIAKPISTPTPSIEPLDRNVGLADDVFGRYLANKSKSTYKFEITKCQGVTSDQVDSLIYAYKNAMTYWASFYNPTAPIKWVLFSEKDYDCWRENVTKIEGAGGDTQVWNPNTGILGHCQVSPQAFCGYGTGVTSNGMFVQYNMIGSKYYSAPNPQVVYHEAVHIYQMALQSENWATSQIRTLPAWFIEGQANLVGQITASGGFPATYRKSEIVRLKNVIPDAGTLTADEWFNKLYALEGQSEFIFRNELGYSLGWIALERVYQLSSQEKMHSLLVHVNQGKSWEQAVATSLGISKADLYKEIAIHLAKEID